MPVLVLLILFVENYTKGDDRLTEKNVSDDKALLSVKEMCSKSRVSHIKTARQIAMYLLHEELSLSTTKIATEVGVKDHTTVLHGINKIKKDFKVCFYSLYKPYT